MNLRAFDLNLLVILDAILTEQSVIGASKRIPLSQPATSLALSRLRTMLDDPILVRTGKKMVPTDRAKELREPVRRILQEIEQAITPKSFDPATSNRIFRITATDHVETVLLPIILEHLGKHAPNTRLVSQSVDAFPLTNSGAREGEIDLTLAYVVDPPESFHSCSLFAEKFVCIARRGHPLFQNGMTLTSYLAARHVMVSPLGGGLRSQVDELLSGQGMERSVVASVPRFSVVPGLVATTDLVSTIPATMILGSPWRKQLEYFVPPFSIPGFDVMMLWHPRHHADEGHRWLRELFRNSAKRLDLAAEI